jgi:3-vinyl bacteriochlorophyllide hydratase
MTAASLSPDQDLSAHRGPYRRAATRQGGEGKIAGAANIFEGWLDSVAACPWGAHAGLHSFNMAHETNAYATTNAGAATTPLQKPLLYTAEQRRRRDASPWTIVQGVLAPLQFLAFAVSLVLIGRYILTGAGYEAATTSILIKTFALYAIMITGSIWEKVVFDKWLFARAFFWEDVFSMLVLALQTAYVGALLLGLGSPVQQMTIALAAYGAYAINATQFLLKLRAARLESSPKRQRSRGRQASLRGSL